MRKKTVIILSVITVIIIAAVIGWQFILRTALDKSIESYGEIGQAAEYFSDFSLLSEENTTVHCMENISFDMPEDFSRNEYDIFEAVDGTWKLMISGTFNPLNFEEGLYGAEALKGNIYGVNESGLRAGYEKLGKGIPDSPYTAMKSAALLSEDDYDGKSIKKDLAYSLLTYLKQISFEKYQKLYIYEHNGACGFIKEYAVDNGAYTTELIIFTEDNLKEASYILITADSPEFAYQIMNSVKPAK
ncbi:MAG: hypothetical protein IKK53_00375 [Ruminiclostridium sp.]|nr:hypothetical protein [Ruminiclostridium sp.]